MTIQAQTSQETPRSGGNYALPASEFSYQQLAEIYNEARVDYIVPMPMNAKRMAEYVHNYDVHLPGSFVSFNEEQLETGVGMLGLRGDRAWITRLGVLPHRRGSRIGQFLMTTMLDYARAYGCRQAQLEVIVGNEPAHRLFLKLGFRDVRELLVIRRAPSKQPPPAPEVGEVTPLETSEIPALLASRTSTPSWLDETPSLLNAGRLAGYRITLKDGLSTWVVFQQLPFQLSHFAFGEFIGTEPLQALLQRIHADNRLQDTKIENLPDGAPEWDALRHASYIEVFRRTEMILDFV